MSEPPTLSRFGAPRRLLVVLVVLLGVVLALAAPRLLQPPEEEPKSSVATGEPELRIPPHLKLAAGRNLTVWWDGPTDEWHFRGFLFV